MENNPICVTFDTYDKHYFYDANRNHITPISGETYQILTNALRSENFYSYVAEIESNSFKEFYNKALKQGFFKPSKVNEIEHPATDLIEHYLQSGMNTLCLQVTQGCNLRCDYCPFSGNLYSVRTHSHKRMSFETAKRAIDYVLKHSSYSNRFKLAFFGGEPLLEFELIKNCVEYLENNVVDKVIYYDITTNATLINDKIMAFLVEKNFQMLISLDGPEEIHDKSRHFVDGRGSHSVVIEKIKKYKALYPKYFLRHVVINSVINYQESACTISDYFSVESLLSDLEIHASGLTETSLKDGVSVTQASLYEITRNFEELKILFDRLGLYKVKNPSEEPSAFSDRYRHICNIAEQLQILRDHIPEKYHPGGPCLPGLKKFFINVDGNMYPCERVNEQAEFLKIGDLDNGIDINKVKAILNTGKLSANECKNCWAMQFCTLCASDSEHNGLPSKQQRLSRCNLVKKTVLNCFRSVCMFKEFGFDFNLEISNYFTK